MSEEEKTSTPSKLSAAPSSLRAESPTTARPMDFDDEPQESGSASTNAGPTATDSPAIPPKPPRPASPREQSLSTLQEAFPSIDATVVRAILQASNWNVERAFHALLGMTDPTAQEEMVPPPKPPRPTQSSTSQRQLEADEQYARQLAQHYNASGSRRQAPAPGWENDPRFRQPRGSEDSEEREYSFFDDDLPVIRENLRKGFLETQSKVNSWVTNLKKKLDGEEEEEAQSSQNYEPPQTYGRTARRSGDIARRSGDRERYDADPQLFTDDFSALELRDSEAPPSRPPRPLAGVVPRTTKSPSPDRRTVSFQDGPPTEINTNFDASRNTASAGKSNKWQPLANVEPSPVAENDPFSLGDSDDEKDTTTKEHVSESVPIKKGTAEAVSGETTSDAKDSKKSEEPSK
ncbi:hypothetical protein N7495_001784 [Penicillium taxi]|uniref:uncharacterized protein n=1 Tax=Penicillium taxi TaxID=168475 RepID=UPI0025453F8C|nr:uncharacterized protein N7495_001784 [Penicillium taxi]KAJ5909102.1 hypothetical protein N7495_001784 [Penicillium taxi]